HHVRFGCPRDLHRRMGSQRSRLLPARAHDSVRRRRAMERLHTSTSVLGNKAKRVFAPAFSCALAVLLMSACDSSGSSSLGVGKEQITGADCGDVSALQAGAPWPMWGGCPAHGGRSDIAGALDGTVNWTFTTQGELENGAVVGSDGTVYIGGRA